MSAVLNRSVINEAFVPIGVVGGGGDRSAGRAGRTFVNLPRVGTARGHHQPRIFDFCGRRCASQSQLITAVIIITLPWKQVLMGIGCTRYPATSPLINLWIFMADGIVFVNDITDWLILGWGTSVIPNWSGETSFEPAPTASIRVFFFSAPWERALIWESILPMASRNIPEPSKLPI